MAAALHVAVRTLHVLGMVVLLGGAAAVWIAARDGTAPHRYAVLYEWAFWGALGVVVATGVGNLGALGPPGPDTRWGTILTVKLGLVLFFVLGSLVRTLVVAGADRDADPGRFYRGAYGATTAVLLALVVLAEVLAHG